MDLSDKQMGELEKTEEVEGAFEKLDEKGRYQLKKLYIKKKQLDKRVKEIQVELQKWDKDIRKLLKIELGVEIDFNDLLIALL